MRVSNSDLYASTFISLQFSVLKMLWIVVEGGKGVTCLDNKLSNRMCSRHYPSDEILQTVERSTEHRWLTGG